TNTPTLLIVFPKVFAFSAAFSVDTCLLLGATTNPINFAPFSSTTFAISIDVMPHIFTFIYLPSFLQIVIGIPPFYWQHLLHARVSPQPKWLLLQHLSLWRHQPQFQYHFH